MKKVTIIFTWLLMGISTAFAQDVVFVADKMKISFFSEARIENIEATSTTGSTAGINVINKDVAFKISILSFRFKNSLMEEHFNENYMDTDKYPYGILKGKILEDMDLTKEGKYNVTVEGMLNVHGVSKPRKFTGIIESKGGRLFLDSEFMLPVSDHNIDIPNDKLSNISQTIKVTIHAEFIPKK
ncbi:MAG: YceI family protein [Chitinophagaceae bacterium]|nr:YceI family protein [Chitinophagaceae bacterium]